jgi:hypothetical protein
MPLSQQEIAQYREKGYVIPSFRLPQETLSRIREAYERLLEAHKDDPDFSPDFILGPHMTSGYGVKGDPAWLDFARDPAILDLLEQVMGPDIILWGVTIFGKPARTGKATPWHQDGDYYPIEPLETTTVWISLDGSTPENGCMRVVPGSHRARKVFKHHWEEKPDQTLAQVIDPGEVDLESAEDLVLEPGQLSIHDVYLVHGSNANRSGKRRMGLVFRYMPGGSFYNHGGGQATEDQGSRHGYTKRALFLLRGRDRSGRNDFSVGHQEP